MRLQFQKRAIQQIDDALRYVATRSPQGASNIEGRVSEILTLLKEQPYLGSKTQLLNIRRVFLTPYPYLMDYFVDGEEIVILRFRHAARKPIL